MITVFALLLLAATDVDPHVVLSVEAVQKIVDARTQQGEIVRVGGFIDAECNGRSCLLLSARHDLDAPSLSIGGGTPVEDALQAGRGRRVVLSAQIGEPSFRESPDGDLHVCADRCSEIIPISIGER